MIVQKHAFGCGVACVAVAANCSYEEACNVLGSVKAGHTGFTCEELIKALNEFGLSYQYKYFKPQIKSSAYKNGAIIFLKRTKKYPAGHYLVRHKNKWHDSWINFPDDRTKAGYRKRLPYAPSYVIFPYNN